MEMEMEMEKKMTKSCFDGYIPIEVLTQILVKLPAKSLVRLRCVCKSWCSIIDNPDFVNIHLHLHLQLRNHSDSTRLLSVESVGIHDRCVLTVRDVNTLTSTEHISKISHRYFLHGGCNSLLLLCRDSENPGVDMELCNPSIRKRLMLPPCPLHCHPSSATFILGFLPRTNGFKVIVITFPSSDREWRSPKMLVAVYTLGDQQWSVRHDGLNIDTLSFRRVFGSFTIPVNACYFRGAAHWLGKNPFLDNYESYLPTHLVSLNFDTEAFEFLELPVTGSNDIDKFVFVRGESLAFISAFHGSDSMWVLKEDGRKKEWSLCFTGPLNVGGSYLFYSNDSRSGLLYYEAGGGCFVYGRKSYNIATCHLNQLSMFIMSHRVELETYTESLVLCKGYGAEDMVSSPFLLM